MGKRRQIGPGKRNLPPVGPVLIARILDEPEIQHRAMLLYGMQDPSRRNRSAVAAVVGRPEVTVRKWGDRWWWPMRLAAQDADMTCIYEYHRNYNERFGVSEVQRVASRMRYTYGAPPPLGEVKHTPTAAIDAALDTELKRRSEQSARRRTALEGLLDGTLQFYGQALTATVHPERPESKGVPKLKIAPGDLASLARLYGFLASVGDDGQVTASRGQALVESVRIRSARAAGADIVQAAVEDVEELRVVLHHMQLAATAAEAVGVDDDGFGGGAAEGEG